MQKNLISMQQMKYVNLISMQQLSKNAADLISMQPIGYAAKRDDLSLLMLKELDD